MRRAQRRLMLLVVGVTILVALALWQWRSERAQATLLTIDPATITRIDVMRPGQPLIHYRKRASHWYRDQQRTNDAYVGKLALLAATPVLQWRPLDKVNLSAIGLTIPPVTVTLDGHKLAYGTLAAFGPQRFVRVGGRIAVIPASYSPRSPKPASPSSSQKS